MNVLHLIQRYPPALGGSETWCRDLCRELAATGDTVKVLTMNILEEEEFWRDPPVDQCTTRLGKLDWDGPVLVRRYERSLPVYSLYHLFFKVVLDRLARVYFYGPHSIEMYGRVLAEARQADVVHLHTVPYPHNFIGYLAARLAGKRVVMTPYFHPGHQHYERRSHYWLLRHCDAVIALSAYERDHLASKGVPASKIIVTGTGIRLEDYAAEDVAGFRERFLRQHGLAAHTTLVLFLGRKTEYKGLDLLIEAVQRLRPRLDIALLMAGPSLAWFDRLYAGLSADDKTRIIDLGMVSHQDKVNLLHLANVLVLPSAFESFGIVFLEAWACGTPVIGTDIGAMPGVIDQGGLVFRPGDAADLAEKIETVVADGHLAGSLAERGAQQLKARYRWPRIADAVRGVYRPPSLCARGRQPLSPRLPRSARRDEPMDARGEVAAVREDVQAVAKPRQPRLRVLFCSNLWPPHVIGGAELAAHAQARALAGAGHAIRVFAGRVWPSGPLHAAVTEGRDFLTTWMNLSPRDLTNEWWELDVEEIRDAFSRVLEEFEPDLVHMHNMVGLATTLADECRARGIPTVMTLHDYWGICFKSTMVKNDGVLCHRAGFDCLDCRETLTVGPRRVSVVDRNLRVLRSLRQVDRFIAPSRYVAECYARNGLEANAITVLPNGIEVARFEPGRDRHEPLTLGFLGYLGAHKGVEYVVRALVGDASLADVRLSVIGDGEDQPRLQALARDLGLCGRVTFHGRVPNRDIPSVYRQIDVLVVPSIWPENSPVTITEAMAAGLPVIASNVGGVPELVEDGVTGILVAAGDTRTLARAIVELRADPERRREMGRRGRARIQEFDVRRQVERLVEIYRDVIEAPRGQRLPPRDEVVLLYEAPAEGSRAEAQFLRQLAAVADRTKRRLAPWRLNGEGGDDIAPGAILAILPGESARTFGYAVRAWLRGMALLVSEQCAEVTALCRSANGGLYYATDEELRRCLELLLEDEELRLRLGENGREFVDRHAGRARP